MHEIVWWETGMLPPELEESFPSGVLLEIALAIVHLSSLNDRLLQEYDLKGYLLAFLEVNQYHLR